MNKRHIGNSQFQGLEHDQFQSAILEKDEELTMSEYQLFKLRQARKAASNQKSFFINSRLLLVSVATVLAVVYLYGYLSEEVEYAPEFHATSENNINSDEIFYQSRQDLDKSNRLSMGGTRLSAQFLPAGISEDQMTFASELKSLSSVEYPQLSPIAERQKAYYIQKYKIDEYEELPFCVVVPTYNNAAQSRHLKNIKTITMQDYQNYHIVVIDDASTDGSGAAILKFLEKESNIERERYQVAFNQERKMAMFNLRKAALQFCQPDEIFLVVDGDDELLGRQVFKVFNAIFQSQSAWFVYSNFINSNSRYGYSRPIPEQIIKANKYRYYPFVTSHLRAFYTKLFQNIREQDLKDEKGEYFKAANDVAICIPVLQQAGMKVYYLAELMYFYNSNTGLNNHKVKQGEQILNAGKIRRKKNYIRLQSLS